MDKFGAVSGNMIGGTQSVSLSPSTVVSAPKRNQRSLEVMSDGALASMIETLKRQQDATRNGRDFSRIQAEIDDMEAELVRRNAPASTGAMENLASDKTGEKISAIGNGIGVGALVFGVVGYLIGKHLNKKPILFGLGGALVGGLGVMWLNKMTEKK